MSESHLTLVFLLVFLLGFSSGEITPQKMGLRVSDQSSIIAFTYTAHLPAPDGFEMVSSNTDIYNYNVTFGCSKHVQSTGLTDPSRNKCFMAKAPFCSKIVLQISTHFYQENTTEFTLDVLGYFYTKGEGEVRKDPLHIENPIVNVNVVDGCQAFVPKSVEEGRRLYYAFEKQHLAKNWSMCRNDYQPKININTIPRSGTHMLIENLQKIINEFIPAPYPYQSDITSYNNGYIMGSSNFSRAVWSHNIPEKDIRRRIFLVRDPLDTVDSYYHFFAFNAHNKKIPKTIEYWKEDLFKSFYVKAGVQFQEQVSEILEFNIPTLVVRFEDLVAEPKQWLGRIVGFYKGAPVYITGLQKSIDKLIEAEKLASHYKTFSGEKQEKRSSDVWTKLGSWFVRNILESCEDSIYLFGYFERYHDFLGIKEIPKKYEGRILSFYERNRRVEEDLYTYRSKDLWVPKPTKFRKLYDDQFKSILMKIRQRFARVVPLEH